MRTLMRSHDRVILGVAGGMAEYLDMDKTVWRAIFLFCGIIMPPVILAYIIMGLVIPAAPAPVQAPPAYDPMAPKFDPLTGDYAPPTPPPGEPVYTRREYQRLTKSHDKWLAGVCGGVAEYFGTDPVLVRALWLAAVFLAGTGLLLYIILAILMPPAPYPTRY